MGYPLSPASKAATPGSAKYAWGSALSTHEQPVQRGSSEWRAANAQFSEWGLFDARCWYTDHIVLVDNGLMAALSFEQAGGDLFGLD